MAHGICNNENCEKGRWWLTKHPDDYANGVNCPSCGTSDVSIDWGEGGQTDPEPEPEPEPQQPERGRQQEVQRETAPQTTGHQTETAPATQQQSSGSLGDVVAVADPDVPTERRVEAAQRAGGMVGGVLGKLIGYKSDKKKQAQDRASQVDIERVQNAPACTTDGCEFVFDEIRPVDDTLKCPQCGASYKVVEH